MRNPINQRFCVERIGPADPINTLQNSLNTKIDTDEYTGNGEEKRKDDYNGSGGAFVISGWLEGCDRVNTINFNS